MAQKRVTPSPLKKKKEVILKDVINMQSNMSNVIKNFTESQENRNLFAGQTRTRFLSPLDELNMSNTHTDIRM